MRRLSTLAAAGLLFISTQAADFPASGWKDLPDPLASRDAEAGGELSYHSGQSPKNLNYYLTLASDTGLFFGLMYDSLLGGHPVTMEDEPAIADRWSIGDDKMTFTFHIDPRAKWSDGKPITAEDVKWTFDAVMKEENLTGPWKTSLERFAKVEVLDPASIRFVGREIHWSLLYDCGGFPILPRHIFGTMDFNKILFDFPVVSGPYMVEEFKENRYLLMKRRADWWGWQSERNRNKLNFERLRFKFYPDEDTAFDAFLNGEFDIFEIRKAANWVNKTTGDRFVRNWIVKQWITNYDPVGFQGWAMNMRKPPFDDVRVRKAMCHLLDRRRMNQTMMYNQYFLHQSYYEDLYCKEHPCPNALVEFDKEAARKLLAEAGYVVNAATGLLEKDGKPLEFQFLTRDADTDRFLAIFNEALKDVGIRMSIIRKDWASWLKDMDEFNFQMTWAAWGAGIRKDPESMWFSKEADRPAGNNINGLKKPAVDELIEKQKSIFDINVRHDIVRQVDSLVYQEYPYILLWNIRSKRLLYWNKFGTPRTVLSKYGDATSALVYWWFDEDAVGDLTGAQKANSSLPQRPATIDFDQEFKP